MGLFRSLRWGILGALIVFPVVAGQIVPNPSDMTNASVKAIGGVSPAPLSGLVPLSLLNFGATCDGTTNDSSAITAAVASNLVINIPTATPCNASSTSWLSMPGTWIGNGTGRIKASDGYLRGPIFMEQTAAPTLASSYNPETYWTGDWSKSIGEEKILLGSATAGKPTTGYVMVPEVSMRTMGEYNQSGWNQSLTGNNGRTAVPMLNLHPFHSGQGDMTALWCAGTVSSPSLTTIVTASFATNVMTVTGTPALTIGVGATVVGAGIAANTIISSLGSGTGGAGTYNLSSVPGTIAAESVTLGASTYLSNAALECMGGNIFFGANGQYAELIGDMNLTDNGFDVAGIGLVFNFARTNATEGLGTNWVGTRLSSNSSTVPIDVFDQRAGPAITGMDYAAANLTFYRLAGFAINNGGTGYTDGDVITVSGGTAITPTVWRATVSAGVITALTTTNTGIYTTAPSSLTSFVTLTVTGGSGTGLNVAGQYSGNIWAALPPAGGCIIPSGTGSVVTRMTGINGIVCINPNGLQAGSLGTNQNTSAAGSNNFQFGANNNTQGSNNTQFGRGCYDQAQKGTFCFSGGSPSGAAGAGQTGFRTMFRTGTAQTRLTSDGAAPSTQNSYLMLRGMDHVRFWVEAVDSTNGDTATWECGHQTCTGTLTLATTGGTVVYAGDASTATAPDRSTGAGSTASLIIAADNATVVNTWNVQVTPPNAHLWYFYMHVDTDRVGF